MTPHSFRTLVVSGVAVFVLAGCGTSAPSSGKTAPDVRWEDYSPAVKTHIDELTATKNCVGLQKEFDVADANNEATKARVGHNNADLMAYIDFQMEAAGCYR